MPFSKLHTLPTYDKSISSWQDPTKAYQNVAQGIQQAISKILIQQYSTDAEISVKNNNYEHALAIYDEAQMCGLDAPILSRGRATVLEVLHRYEEALVTYEHALRLAPNHAQTWRHTGRVHMALGNLDEALHTYERAIQLEPNNPHFYKEYGDVLCEFGRWFEAIDAYDMAMRLKPDLGSVYLSKCRVYTILEQQAEESRHPVE